MLVFPRGDLLRFFLGLLPPFGGDGSQRNASKTGGGVSGARSGPRGSLLRAIHVGQHWEAQRRAVRAPASCMVCVVQGCSRRHRRILMPHAHGSVHLRSLPGRHLLRADLRRHAGPIATRSPAAGLVADPLPGRGHPRVCNSGAVAPGGLGASSASASTASAASAASVPLFGRGEDAARHDPELGTEAAAPQHLRGDRGLSLAVLHRDYSALLTVLPIGILVPPPVVIPVKGCYSIKGNIPRGHRLPDSDADDH